VKTVAKGVGVYLAVAVPLAGYAAWSESRNMAYHTRSIRERAEIRGRLDEMGHRLDRLNDRVTELTKQAAARPGPSRP
jgi:hypothetical protein